MTEKSGKVKYDADTVCWWLSWLSNLPWLGLVSTREGVGVGLSAVSLGFWPSMCPRDAGGTDNVLGVGFGGFLAVDVAEDGAVGVHEVARR